MVCGYICMPPLQLATKHKELLLHRRRVAVLLLNSYKSITNSLCFKMGICLECNFHSSSGTGGGTGGGASTTAVCSTIHWAMQKSERKMPG